MHHAELRVQSGYVVVDVSLETFNVQAIGMKRMQYGLLVGVPAFPPVWGSMDPRFLAVLVQALHEALEKVACEFCGGLERGRLEVLEARVVEDLPDTALERSTTRPRSHHWPVIGNHNGLNVLLGQRHGVVLLELVLVHLIWSAMRPA